MRLLVCGNRDWIDSGEIAYHMALIFGQERDRLVIHGNSGDLFANPPRGADKLAGFLAGGVGAAVEVYAVNHRIDGPWPGAGPARNARMLRDGNPDRGLAFGRIWKQTDPNGHRSAFKLTGTGDMVQRMLRSGIEVRWVPTPNAIPSLGLSSRYINLTEMPGPS